MSLTVLAAVEADMPAFGRLGVIAVSQDAFGRCVSQQITQAEFERWMTDMMVQRFRNENIRHVKVVDTELDQIISVAAWSFPKKKGGSEEVANADEKINGEGEGKGESEEITEALVKEVRLPEGLDPELLKGYRAASKGVVDRWWNVETGNELLSLGTLPEHERRGAATMLLKWGIECPERTDEKIWIRASNLGLSLYEKLGWRKADEMRIDLAPYGLDEADVIHYMSRDGTHKIC